MNRVLRAISLVVLACALAACATVPDTHDVGMEQSQIRIATQSGWLSYQRSQDIIRTLDKEEAHRSSRDQASPDADAADGFLRRHMAVEEAINDSPLMGGNRVTLLTDGPSTYRAMLEAIRGARQYVHMESYIFNDDDAGRAFAEAFIERRRAGVAVALMVDSVGTLGTPKMLFKRMQEAGVQVVFFNPVNPVKAGAGWAPNNRDHRKLLVVDGKVGFLGGINISSVYESSPSGQGSGSLFRSGADPENAPQNAKDAPWRDTHIRVEGPAVAEIEQVMQGGWRDQHGPPLDIREFFPAAERDGDTVVRIIANRPGDRDGYTLYLTLMSAIQSAQHSVHITMAYFVPDPAFIRALSLAAQRGSDVAIVLPGFSDSTLVFHAGRSYYSELLEAGVKIYERRDAMLHAKTAVIDGVWSTVGSSNMDWRSFALNYELNAVILGSKFGAQMEALFQQDVAASSRVRAAAWAHRGIKNRFLETVSRLFERWL